MRHLPESLLQPALRILSECEASLKAKHHRSLREENILCDISRVRGALRKQYKPHKHG